MQFRVLGRLEVEADGVDLTPARLKQRALLALLLLRAGEVVRTDDLVEALWGERPPETAQTALHGHISTLRKRLGPGRIETRAPGYVLRLGDDDDLDLHRLERVAAEARREGPLLRSAKLGDALALFRGEPLADFRYEAFARQEAARLEEVRLAFLEEQIEADLELGRHVEALPRLEHLVGDHPLRERLRYLLMLALYRAGRQADALHAFGGARRVLVAELGIEPGPALQRLERQILNQDPELAGPDLFTPVRGLSAASKPAGIVTFLFAALDDLGPSDGTPDEPLELMRAVVRQHGGFELETPGESFLVAFARAGDAAAAAVGIQRATTRAGGGVRIGIHSSDAVPTDEGYAGPGVRGAAGVCAAAHPGQALLSQTTRDLLREARLDEANLRDVGEHHLNDLAHAQRLFQLVAPGLEHEFQPPRGLETRPTNLPLQPAPLIGREREIREAKELLNEPAVGLVTFTGPGGTGKTRLAVHLAAELLDEFADGVFFVPLAPLADPGLVLSTVARTLGVPDVAGETTAATLGRGIGSRRLLLVLDNFEHLLQAAPAVAELAEVAAATKILVTSRAPLRVSAERVYPVSPLETPNGRSDVELLLELDSVALFVARARAVRPDFSATAGNARPVAGICEALDGLPLAIELAATRVGVLSPEALLQRLDDRLRLLAGGSRDPSGRHRTLRAAIDWSYDLLEPEEQRLFARLAVFAGGSTLEAAERVCGNDLDVVDGLASLLDKSLLRVEGDDAEPRFAMLETIREYAAEQLEHSAEGEEWRRRHAEHFLALAEEAEPHLRGTPREWLERLERDHDNLRAALDRLESSDETELELRLAGALWRFWYLRGHLAEGRRHLKRALGGAEHVATAARGKALIGAAVMAVNSDDLATARLRAEESLALHRRLGDPWGSAYSLFMLAAAVSEGRPSHARDLYEESARIFGELGDEHSALLATRHLAFRCAELGDAEQARALHEENLRRARTAGNGRIEASTLGTLAMTAIGEGRVDDALSMLQTCLRVHCDLGDLLDTAVDLCRAAFVLAFEGKATTAVQLLSSIDAHRERIGSRHSSAAELNAQTLAIVRTQLDEAAFTEAWRQGQALTVDEAAALARDSLD